MKITAISVQVRNKSRVNVSVDGRYRFSLEIQQLAELGLRVGAEFTDEELTALEEESKFGKVYVRALEYCFTRPRSRRELNDYLYRKTRSKRGKEGQILEGISPELAERVRSRLDEKGYLDDEKFARFWVENRNVRKGSSARKLKSELQAKGVEQSIVEMVLSDTDRSDDEEIDKIILKKARRYDDRQKFMAYLARQGFGFDEIISGLERFDQAED
jgi:regulatory protein